MKTLMILNDAPYGSERTYNGLRLRGIARPPVCPRTRSGCRWAASQ